MATITFDVAAFRVQFPEFANETTYPDSLLQQYWDMATCYISDENCGVLRDNCRLLALNLMTAHLVKLSTLIAANQVPGLAQSASVGSVSVTLTPPPVGTQYNWWLGLTAYGQQLLALLQAKSVGGFYIGGSPERSAFRKVNGMF